MSISLKTMPVAFSFRTFGMALSATAVLLLAFFFTTGGADMLKGGSEVSLPFATVSIIDPKAQQESGHAEQPEDATETVAVSSLNEADKVGATETAPPPIPVKTKEKIPQAIEDMVAGLHENKPEGLIPMVRADGVTPFQSYRAAFSPSANTKALVALVMIDYGLSAKNSEAALKDLPSGTSFAASPYANEPQEWFKKARSLGHEVWMSVPVQSSAFPDDDSGSNTILANSGADQKQHRLFLSLGKATGYPGIISLLEPGYARSKIDLDYILTTLGSRGLGYVESDHTTQDVSAKATEMKVPFGQAKLWLDNQPDPASIQQSLAELEQQALSNQKAIAFFRPMPVTMKTILPWIESARKKGIEIAPISAVIDLK